MRLETLSPHQKRVLSAACVIFLVLMAIGLWTRSSVDIGSKETPLSKKDAVTGTAAVARVISPSISGSNHNTFIFDAAYRDSRLTPSTYAVKAGDTVHLSLDSTSKATIGIPALGLSREIVPWSKAFLEFNSTASWEYAIECESCNPKKNVWRLVVE